MPNAFSKPILKLFTNGLSGVEDFINESAHQLLKMDDVQRSRYLMTNEEVNASENYYLFDSVVRNGRVQRLNPIYSLVHNKYSGEVNKDKIMPPVSGPIRMLCCF